MKKENVNVPVSKLGYDTQKELATMKSVPPQSQGPASLQSAEKRLRLAGALNAYSDTLTVAPVRSNRELLERGEQYFKFCADRLLYPTYEGLAAFCGYSNNIFFRWGNTGGPFHDGPDTTGEVLERLKAVIDAIDGDLVADGSIEKVQWIFRRKAQSGWVEKTQVEVVDDKKAVPDALPPEEIAKMLPGLIGMEQSLGENGGINED